jgi:hypothetical protein
MGGILKMTVRNRKGIVNGTIWCLGCPEGEDSEYLMTNYHVMHPKDENNVPLEASCYKIHLDYCVFKVKGKFCETPIRLMKLMANQGNPGDVIANIGFPLFTPDLRTTFNNNNYTGQIISISEVLCQEGVSIYHASFTLPGSSGSILFDPITGYILGLHKVFRLLIFLSPTY